MPTSTDIVGLIPAAGRGSRMQGLPFSKELLPLANASQIPRDTAAAPRVAIDHALETMTAAGVFETCVVLAPGKWDIPTHVGNGAQFGQRVAYVVAEASRSVPESLDAARIVTRDREVALLFPDIVFSPKGALGEIIEHRRKIDADLVLALVPAESGEKIDLVTVASSGLVVKVTPKPGKRHSGWTWVAATWNPGFSGFLHRSVPEAGEIDGREFYVADVLNLAIGAGLRLGVLFYRNGNSFDLGTPDELERFWQSGSV